MNVRHPVWCNRARCTVTVTAEQRVMGSHQSAQNVIQPRENETERLEVRLSRGVAPGRLVPALVTIEGFDSAYDPPDHEVFILSQRQAFLLARAIDGLLIAAWFPEDFRPAGLGVFADRDDPVTGEPVPPHVEGIPVRRPDSPEGGERS